MEKENIIEKIRKLLKKNGRTPEEAETALSLAQKLAAKHSIDINSINPDESYEPITHELVFTSCRMQMENKYAAMICSQYFNVSAFTRRDFDVKKLAYATHMMFVGTAADKEIARFVYVFLVRHFRYLWKTKRGRTRNRNAFMQGIYWGICSKLNEGKPELSEGEGLILSGNRKRIKDYCDRNFRIKEVETKAEKAEAAINRGYFHGRQTEIRKAVKTQTTKLIEG
jgi:hypothetical protein